MTKSNPEMKFTLYLWCVLSTVAACPAEQVARDCRPLIPSVRVDSGPERFHRGLLWRITRPGITPNYLFGTIHVSDDRILNLPLPVSNALASSRVFVMETVPDVNQVLLSGNRMFYHDGGGLERLLPDGIYRKTVTILSAYDIPAEAVAILKPWAAFLTMNYPPETGTILDLELLRLARNNHAGIHGLETMEEQLDVLDHLALEDQITLLIDSVCNYDLIAGEFAAMKTLYLDRDLRGLVEFSSRFTVAEDDAYKTLIAELLTRRNHRMSLSMRAFLDQGSAFIAIGAMHLPGDEGVLHLLEQMGYEVTAVY